MGWRGIGSPDAESRRYAAKSIGVLSTQGLFNTMQQVLDLLLQRFSNISRNDVESRHGCLLSISATVDVFTSQWEAASLETRETSEAKAVSSRMINIWEIFGAQSGPTDDDLTFQTSRPELTAEASSSLISSLSRFTTTTGLAQPRKELLDRALQVLSLCVSRGDDVSIETSSSALSQLFPLLAPSAQEETVRNWFSHLRASWRMPTGRGRILALGAVFKQLGAHHTLQEDIVSELIHYTGKEELIEKRVTAVKCLAANILPYMGMLNVSSAYEASCVIQAANQLLASTESLANNFLDFLNDYTTDRRGDVGSLIRVEAIQAVSILLQSKTIQRSPLIHGLVGCICRLACEKLDKVRLQAWLCLQDIWESCEDLPPLER
jgi:hypothetical protein